MTHVMGVSLSEPYTWLHCSCACVCLLACLLEATCCKFNQTSTFKYFRMSLYTWIQLRVTVEEGYCQSAALVWKRPGARMTQVENSCNYEPWLIDGRNWAQRLISLQVRSMHKQHSQTTVIILPSPCHSTSGEMAAYCLHTVWSPCRWWE